MFLWFIGGATVVVWTVFQDPAIDFRLVMAGSVLPDVVDGLTGARVLHSLAGCAVLLVAVMVATRHRRPLRRRLLGLPIGAFVHLVLDGVWTDARTLWWPARGWSFSGDRIPSLQHPGWLTGTEEVAGALLLLWCAIRFGLRDEERRSVFVRTGRLRSR